MPIVQAPARVQRAARRRYEGFPDLKSCWEQSKEHKRYFIDYLDCPYKALYHKNRHACKRFDTIVRRWASEAYKTTFFGYYRVHGRRVPAVAYRTRLPTEVAELRSLARLSIVKLERAQVGEPLPPPYSDWPSVFTMESVVALSFADEKAELLASIVACIERRQEFRNACVRACCSRIDTRAHDDYLLILHILRARLLLY
jgi:hypothetical protein